MPRPLADLHHFKISTYVGAFGHSASRPRHVPHSVLIEADFKAAEREYFLAAADAIELVYLQALADFQQVAAAKVGVAKLCGHGYSRDLDISADIDEMFAAMVALRAELQGNAA